MWPDFYGCPKGIPRIAQVTTLTILTLRLGGGGAAECKDCKSNVCRHVNVYTRGGGRLVHAHQLHSCPGDNTLAVVIQRGVEFVKFTDTMSAQDENLMHDDILKHL
jgi:hypothetical protein